MKMDKFLLSALFVFEKKMRRNFAGGKLIKIAFPAF
jgi:hypothetical protein